VVHQHSPIEVELTPAPTDCPNASPGCFAYSADGSLLFPTTSLSTEYFALARATAHISLGGTWSDLPGFLAITATANGTLVQIRSSSAVTAGDGVQAMTVGGTQGFTLEAGDVLLLTSAQLPAGPNQPPAAPCITDINTNIFCPGDPAYDLSGTQVSANQPVSVLAGHDCAFVPFDKMACDHIEDSMVPVSALGRKVIISAPQSVQTTQTNPGQPGVHFVRVLSPTNGNALTFEPAVHPPAQLNVGQWLDIGPVSQDFQITGTAKIAVIQYLVAGTNSDPNAQLSDPSVAFVPPVDQYLTEYSVFVPAGYPDTFVGLTAPATVQVLIDGMAVAANEFQPLGFGDVAVARHRITPGYHRIKASQPFGAMMYGYAQFVSFLYPAGLALASTPGP
jgi:hypothetical protein